MGHMPSTRPTPHTIHMTRLSGLAASLAGLLVALSGVLGLFMRHH